MRLKQPLLAILFLLILSACGDETPAQKGGLGSLDAATIERLVTAFNLGVGEMDRYEPGKAVPHFEEVVRLAPDWTIGRLNLGIALLNVDEKETFPLAEKELRRVVAEAPDDPRGPYSLGMLLVHLMRYEEAEPLFERVLELDPDDLDTHVRLGMLRMESDPAAARRHLELVHAAMPHHEVACYRLFTLMRDAGEIEKSQEMLGRFRKLKDSGAGTSSAIKFGEMGRYADIVRAFGTPVPREPEGTRDALKQRDVAGTRGLVAVGKRTPGWPGTEGAWPGPGLAVADVDGDGDLDVYVASLSPREPGRLWMNAGGRFSQAEGAGLTAIDTIGATFGDYDGDGDPDLYVTRPGPNVLYRNEGAGVFEDVTSTAGAGAGDCLSLGAAWADADHDGDLDLYVAQFAARASDGSWARGAPNALLQNGGTGSFEDIAVKAGADGGDAATNSVAFFDADGDRDQDIYLVNDDAPGRLFLNDRVGYYHEADRGYEALVEAGPGLGAVVVDVDGNGLEDVLLLRGTSPPRLIKQVDRGRYEATNGFALPGVSSAIGALAADLDLDGDVDFLFLGVADNETGDHLLSVNRGGGEFHPPVTCGAQTGAAGVRGAVAADLDGDGAVEVLVARAQGPVELLDIEPPGKRHWLVLEPARSGADGEIEPDPSAMGLRAQVQTGRHMQSATVRSLSGYLGGTPAELHFGLGTASKADYVRVTWPDAALQSELEVIPDRKWRLAKVERKPSSCPLLFTWDGERFAYVTDFLGVGGLGFFIAPGTYAPPDPTEDVRVPPALIAPRDGHYLMRVAEPLEEVTYLDDLHLVVYDHPEEWEVHPDERFASEAPFPTGAPYAISQKVFAREARDDKGRDKTDTLREIDRDYVIPPVDPRFVGFAHDHYVDLDFTGRVPAVPEGRQLVLFLHGWVEYTYSHVNFAAWQAGVGMRPPQIEVPDGKGGWRVAIQDAGFPAGLPRMMTVDVTDLDLANVGKLRIRTNMEIFWDQAFLAVAESAARVQRHRLDPSKAVLRFLGYPREYSPDGRIPTCYDYDRIEPGLPYKILSGAYTRYGDVRPLLKAPDDRYVIIGRGEEIELEFDARGLPALREGYTRTLVLHTEGWCKDMDLYTAFPDTVEPLPFRGMKNYPPKVAPPDTSDWRDWQAKWNTRVVRDTDAR